MMQSIKFHRAFFVCLFLSLTCLGQTTDPKTQSGLEFEISGVRFMSAEERARKAGDNLDPDVIMKCRISNQGTGTVYLYTDFGNTIVPRGHVVSKTDNGLIWLSSSSSKHSTKSFGFSPLKSGSWLTLFDGDGVEWDCGDISTVTEETHAKTSFMRFGNDPKVVEVFSNFYTVPAKRVEVKDVNKHR